MVHLKLMQFEKIFIPVLLAIMGPSIHSSGYMLEVISYIYIASMPKAYIFFLYNWFVEYCKTFKIQVIYVLGCLMNSCI